MEEIKKTIDNNEQLKTIRILKGDKLLKMSLTRYDELAMSLSYIDDDRKAFRFQEDFVIGKEDEEIYAAVNGTFASFSGDVFFDTYGAQLMLLNEEGTYRFFFIDNSLSASNEIKCRFFDDSVENRSMRLLFDRLQGLEETKEKARVLSKTLHNIVEK